MARGIKWVRRRSAALKANKKKPESIFPLKELSNFANNTTTECQDTDYKNDVYDIKEDENKIKEV